MTTTDETSPGWVAETVIALAIQARIPVYVSSEPGAGKSSATAAIADALKERLHTIMLSVREPSDQGGMPAIVTIDGQPSIRLVPPGWTRDLIRDDGGIVFLDEITSATPATMNSALRVVQEGVVGDGEKLPTATSFVLAGNPAASNLGANELTAGMANRSLHVAWPFDYQRWREGMLRGWSKVDRQVTKLPSNWQNHRPDMAGLVVAFLDTRPQLAQCQPTDLAQQGGAWPSGRTWDLTATMLVAAKATGHGPKSIVARTIVLGLVGEAACTEWSSWVANMDLPSIADVMAEPATIKLPTRQDQIQAVLSGVVAYTAARRSDMAIYMAAWTVVNRVLIEEPSMAVAACRDLGGLAPPGADQKNGTSYQQGLKLVAEHLGKSGADYGRRT